MIYVILYGCEAWISHSKERTEIEYISKQSAERISGHKKEEVSQVIRNL
jgi:hypothetical protein